LQFVQVGGTALVPPDDRKKAGITNLLHASGCIDTDVPPAAAD